MPTEVLYRKWRPQRFIDVSGHEPVTRTLLNAVAGRRVSHAYLFWGPRGTGKTTLARLLSKAINCEQNSGPATGNSGEPCNECASCRSFGTGSALDLIEMDGASNRGINEIRDLRENANYLPMAGADAHKVYLIDEVHMLTEPAFNALLKTLEEPPPHVVFILATTDQHKVPATIVSRCQRHEFKRIPVSAMADRMAHIAAEEGLIVPREGLEMIARHATGSLRDAINLLEQISDTYGTEISLEAIREGLGLIADARAAELAIQSVKGNFPAGLATIGSVTDDGLDLKQFQKEVVLHLRHLLLVQASAAADGEWTPEQVAEMKQSIDGVPREKLIQALRAFGQADLRADPLSPLPLELALADAALAPEPRPAAEPVPMSRPAPTRAPTGNRQPPPPIPPPPAPRPAARQEPDAGGRAPTPIRADLKDASAEEIARMLGSSAPVIPPATEQDIAAPAANGTPVPALDAGVPPVDGAPPADGELSNIVTQMYASMRQEDKKLAPYLNGSCHAVSWQDGILTLGFYADFHKGKVTENLKAFEALAARILGANVSIRCIMAPRPAKPLSKSPLVQHAVQAHGATVVSRDEEP